MYMRKTFNQVDRVAPTTNAVRKLSRLPFGVSIKPISNATPDAFVSTTPSEVSLSSTHYSPSVATS